MKIFSLLMVGLVSASANLPEVDLVFYGRVLHLGGGQPHVMTAGELTWMVENGQEEEPFLGKTDLSAMKGGAMSYQLRVPQSVVVQNTAVNEVAGLSFDSFFESEIFHNTTIALNGVPLRLYDASAASMELSARSRGSFKRLDFIYEGSLPDADGDGLPDWWEDEHGTDRTLADATADPDGDSSNNLAEYLAGTSPTGDDQLPRLAGEYLLHLSVGGKAVPTIQAIDADSSPGNLSYQLGSLPSGLTAHLVGEEEPVASFTQKDLNEGRVYFQHDGQEEDELAVAVSLQDETPAHAAAESQLRILVREEQLLWDGWELGEVAMPSELPAIQDGSRNPGGALLRSPSGAAAWGDVEVSSTETDMARLFLGAGQADVMLGSSEGDYFLAGAGDQVQPGEGSDVIVVAESAGLFTVRGFEPLEGDVLNLAAVLEPSEGRNLSDYARLSGSVLEVDINGDGSGFHDISIVFEESNLPNEVADLWDSGNLETGTIVPRTTLYLAAEGTLSEEGLQVAEVSFRRRGDASEELVVPLGFAGTAAMGLDFASLPSELTFAEGEKTASLTVQPFADDELEPTETVQIAMLAGDWDFGESSSTVTLDLLDLPSRVWLEIAERVAVRDFASSAQVLLRRSGQMSAPLTVRLQMGGSATAFLDYVRLSPTATFAPAQSVLALDIEPLSSALLTHGAETVEISLVPDEGYLFGATSSATILLVESPSSIAQFMSDEEVTQSRAEFLAADEDGDGLNGFAEFAFGGSPTVADFGVAYPVLTRQESGAATVSYRRRPFAPELSYRLESSTDLEHWVAVPSEQETSSQILSDGMEEVTVVLEPATDACCFFRVIVGQ